jgi:ribosome biogenesis GTPase / thiamine phosphate phosphatase
MIETLDFEALRSIGLSQAMVARMVSLAAEPGDRPMRITEVQRDHVLLHDGRAAVPAHVWPTLQVALQVQGEPLVVGDWVLARPAEEGARLLGWWVTARVPPETRLLRRDARGERQALVANVDTALLVMGMGHDFNLRRLDRYLALVRLAGVQPVVVLSKADLHPAPAERVAAVHAHFGLAAGRMAEPLAVLALDGRDGQAREVLQPWLGQGRTLVLMGSSGAGKSTLTNTLSAGAGGAAVAQQATGEVRAGDERGRHTTTTRTLYRCPAGACIIDTPGLRGLQLDADEAQLDAAFDDVASLAVLCRFRDCGHGDEPGCAVRPAIAPERLLSYQKLMREARRHEMTVLEKQAQMAVWKHRSRVAKAVIRGKRG